MDCYRTLHPHEPGCTYPAHAPWLRLDHVFASQPLAQRLQASDLVEGETVKRASDHFPIWAEFGIS